MYSDRDRRGYLCKPIHKICAIACCVRWNEGIGQARLRGVLRLVACGYTRSVIDLNRTANGIVCRWGGYRRSRIAHLEGTVRGWIRAEADLTLAQLAERLAAEGIQIKVPALWHQLNKWNLSFKKNPARQRARARRRTASSA